MEKFYKAVIAISDGTLKGKELVQDAQTLINEKVLKTIPVNLQKEAKNIYETEQRKQILARSTNSRDNTNTKTNTNPKSKRTGFIKL
ncbi:MAG: hypothetical protein RCG15_03465 [Candidatus Rickettsia vulgarisii]